MGGLKSGVRIGGPMLCARNILGRHFAICNIEGKGLLCAILSKVICHAMCYSEMHVLRGFYSSLLCAI